jgi:tripeptidyl-peptidase-1
VPENYAVTVCNLIAMLGLRGITVIESSGDLGVGAGCLAPNNKTVEFNAIFPATCPYLTSVGGTVAVTPEIAWEGSSGGFSKYFTRPPYQENAIAAYVAQVDPTTIAYYSNYTNFAGRGFPDVSAHSVSPPYQVVYNGKVTGSGGTSAAAPVWAGIAALLNDARIRKGKPVLGWLNPLIYGGGFSALNDITGGYSIGCNGYNTQSGGREPAGSGIVPYARWNATQGWDPVTGYGTPDFQALKDYALSL